MAKILLIRHAKPVIDYSACTYKQARDRLNDYNITNKLDFNGFESLNNALLGAIISDNAPIIYTSSLSRAIETANFIFNPWQLSAQINPIFSEFDLNIINVPLVKFTVKTWFLISRLAWFAGVSNYAKSIKQEINRSKAAACILEQHYLQNQTVIVVGHGLINHFIANFFRKNGFQVKKHKENEFYTIS